MNPSLPENGSSGFLEEIVAKKSVVVCVGAGGTGKTTMAAALAVRAAYAGRKVVCLTIDPARRLADSLGVHPGDVLGGLKDITPMLNRDVESLGKLYFGMLSPSEVFEEYVNKQASSPKKARAILDNNLYRYISSSLSGMQEYMALEKLYEIRKREDVDLVVLDTPPTANAMDFFTAPSRVLNAVDGPLIKLMRSIHGKSDFFGFNVLSRWSSAVLDAISKVTGTHLLNEIAGFVDALSDLFGNYSKRVAEIEGILRGSSVAFCLVTTPDKSTLRETKEFRAELAKNGMNVDAVIFNKVHWPQVPVSSQEISSEDRELVGSINREWNVEFEREQELVKQVQELWSGSVAVEMIPLVWGSADRLASIENISDFI